MRATDAVGDAALAELGLDPPRATLSAPRYIDADEGDCRRGGAVDAALADLALELPLEALIRAAM